MIIIMGFIIFVYIIYISNSYIKNIINCFYQLSFIVVVYQYILFTKSVIRINIHILMVVLYCRELVYYYVCVR